MRSSRRWSLIGSALGCGLAVWHGLPQVLADRDGVKVFGYAEAMFLLSLPTSLLTWLVWLMPASTIFGSDDQIPRWVAYTWMAVTPPLDWGLLGWLLGSWRDRRAQARVSAALPAGRP